MRVADRRVWASRWARDPGWRGDPVLLEHVERRLVGRRVGDGGPRGDHRRVVAGYVGDDHGEHRRRPGGDRETSSRDRREVLAHAVEGGDRRPAAQQRRADLTLVGKLDAGRGQRQQRRPAARDQAQHEIVAGQTGDLGEHAAGGGATGLVGQRMGGFEHLDALAGDSMAVGRDDQSRQRSAPVELDGSRHGRRRLAGADDDGPTAGRRRQLRGHHGSGRHGRHGRLEQRPQARPGSLRQIVRRRLVRRSPSPPRRRAGPAARARADAGRRR